MANFKIVKTVSYYAEVDIEADTPREALAILERDGDSWVEYEQISGNNDITVYPNTFTLSLTEN